MPFIYAFIGEYPTLLEKVKVCGIVPNAQYNNRKTLNYLNNHNMNWEVELLGKKDLDCLTDQDYIIQVGDDFSNEIAAFVTNICNELEKRGLVVQRELDSVLNALDVCRNKETDKKCFDTVRHQLQTIQIPIIGVGAMVAEYDTAEIITNLKNYLSSEMKVSCVYAHSLLNAYGMNCINENDLEKRSFEEKIFFVNWYLNEVIEQENPDVLLVQIPGGLMQINSKYLNGGGEYPFIYSQAVSFDYVICSLPINDIRSFSFVVMDKYLGTKYGFTNIYYHISNMLMMLEMDIEEGHIPYVCVDEEQVAGEISVLREREINLPVYNFLDKAEIVRWSKAL